MVYVDRHAFGITQVRCVRACHRDGVNATFARASTLRPKTDRQRPGDNPIQLSRCDEDSSLPTVAMWQTGASGLPSDADTTSDTGTILWLGGQSTPGVAVKDVIVIG